MSIPRHLHQAWFGAKPTAEIIGYMAGVKAAHPGWTFFIWDETTIKYLGLDFEHLLFECKSMAGVSNIVRLHAVNQFGGIWLDADCEILKPLDPLLEYDAFAAPQDGDRLCNAVFGAHQQHPFIEWQVEREDRLKTQDAADGVYLMSEAPLDGVIILPTEYFYPFTHETPITDRKAHPDSFLIHHWQGSWSKNKTL